MSYAEQRVNRQVQQLKAELRRCQEREQKTRQGSLDLARALTEIVTSAGPSMASACPNAGALLAAATAMLAPEPDGAT